MPRPRNLCASLVPSLLLPPAPPVPASTASARPFLQLPPDDGVGVSLGRFDDGVGACESYYRAFAGHAKRRGDRAYVVLWLNHASGSRRAEATVVLQASLDFLQDISRYWNNVSYMTTALKRFSDDSHNFAELISDALIIKPFSQEECETLLTLVDYSTISNAPSASRVKDSAQYGPDLLSDVHNSWFDLFEGVVDADLTVSDMELPVNFGVADYASAM
ncbi:hypothetical protein BGW36DRAFT_362128 [Talaromyces proteolyticus]|uniref:Uncharacterized protein n=1 Tax=Talaromyces proteolyticus TaxID=1131652 RepID=A0AAD4KHT9_9EURO|nr:uncharacterized protein BGW36DRAFT_362128 [Talaromyces proteolyticus]KAH8692573.1 hypothetical protein BGW36DRAFT_362128 [Talaromyces proteolyticus]